MAQDFKHDRDYQNLIFGNMGQALREDFDSLLSNFSGSTAPINPVVGQPWYDTSNDILKRFNGNEWVEIDKNTKLYNDLMNAKGTKDSLWERLAVSLNEDGTLKNNLEENMTEWIDSGLTPTYVSGNEFTVMGNQTDIFVQFRKVKATLDASTVYSSVLSSSYDNNNDETNIVLRENVIDDTINKIEHGLIKPNNNGSLPFLVALNTYYDNSDSSLLSTNVKEALDEIISNFKAEGDIDLGGYNLLNVNDIKFNNVYGFEQNWDTDTITRLEGANGLNSSDFNNIHPWSNMRRCNQADDRTINAYYGDPTYVEDGSNGQVMVEIPKFWYRVEHLTVNGEQITRWYVTNEPKSGFKVHPAFIREGKERSFIYVAAFEGTLYDNSAENYVGDGVTYDYSDDKLASVAGLQPISGDTDHLDILEARQLAMNRGNGWGQRDALATWAVNLLIYTEYANFNSQSVLSEGILNLDSGSGNQSQNTGHTSSLGNDSGEVVLTELENGATGATETYPFSYRGIENWYGNIWEFIDGLVIKDDGYYYESDFSKWNSDGSGYTHIQTSPITSDGYIDVIAHYNNFDFSFIGESTSGGSTSYLSDYQWSHDSGEVNIARGGGHWYHGSLGGVGYLRLDSAVGDSPRYISARLLSYSEE